MVAMMRLKQKAKGSASVAQVTNSLKIVNTRSCDISIAIFYHNTTTSELNYFYKNLIYCFFSKLITKAVIGFPLTNCF